MSRNWLRAHLLPSKFWWFAVKRATELQNLLPIKKNGIITTPHELVHGDKVDYHCLFPMFSTAYIRKPKISQGKQTGRKWKSKSLKCIVVGQCPKSDGMLFYHPPSKQTISCGDGYKFDMFHPSGPEFGLKYDSNFTMNTRSDMDCIHRPPSHEENTKVYVKVDDQIVEAKILSVPVDEGDENFVVHITTTGDIQEFPASEIMDHDLTIAPTDADNAIPFPLLPWIKHNSKVTLYLPNRMTTPKQGFLHLKDEEWIFQPGRKPGNKATPIELPDFKEIAQSMINNKKLFNGWKNKNTVITARVLRAKSNIIA